VRKAGHSKPMIPLGDTTEDAKILFSVINLEDKLCLNYDPIVSVVAKTYHPMRPMLVSAHLNAHFVHHVPNKLSIINVLIVAENL
jgi:hypothetical protein